MIIGFAECHRVWPIVLALGGDYYGFASMKRCGDCGVRPDPRPDLGQEEL